MPTPVDFGSCENGRCVYTLLDWIEGIEVEDYLSTLTEKEQYLLGVKAGAILKKIHEDSYKENSINWSERYFTIIKPRIDAYKSEGEPFEGANEILDYLEDNKYLLDSRPQCQHHGDYHIGNMILSKESKLFIIDWHTVDFMNFGDPWYEFNRVDTEFTAFTSGQISGYFEGEVPLKFWKLFAYYFAASTITSIVWAKYYSPESLEEIQKKNKDVFVWFENMKNPIPTWYKRYS